MYNTKYTFSDDRDDKLIHYGVLGMKWGVRNADTQRKYSNYPMTKKEAKKAIRSAKRAERKRTGTWMSTGKNMNRVEKSHSRALSNDSKLKDISDRQSKLSKKIEKKEAVITEAGYTKDHLTRLQQDPAASKDMRREVEKSYLKQRDASKKAQKSLPKLQEDYEKSKIDYEKRRNAINQRYINKYKEAAVKDLNIRDIEAGMRMLEDYGLVNKATRMNFR